MTRILIRCDASLLIGSGHVIRCRTLARELERRGAAVTFLCRRQPGDLINLLEQEFSVLALPEQSLVDCLGLESRELYAAWLGCDQDLDAAQCLEVLAQSGFETPNWLITDHYGLDVHWEAQLLDGLTTTTGPPKLLVIDDLADRQHQADFLLDQNFFGEVTHHRYKNLVPLHCIQFLGPHYALLGPEYAQLHPLVPPRHQLKRVLLFFGGVDPDFLTGRSLEALMDPALADIAVDVVLGHQSPHRLAVEKIVATRPHTTLYAPQPSLAGLIARADLAIGAGGASIWERSCLGLPSLVVAIAANQRPFSEALDHAGYLHFLGDSSSVTSEHIRRAVLAKLGEVSVARTVIPLSDGWGASRLATAMLGMNGPITLRPAQSIDEPLLNHWDNESSCRHHSSDILSMSNKNPPSQSNCLLFIALTADCCPIGYIRFDCQPVHGSAVDSETLVDFSLDLCVRSQGLASDLVRLGFQAKDQWWGRVSDGSLSGFSVLTDKNACFVRPGLIPDEDLPSLTSSPASGFESIALAPGRITLLSDRHSWLNPTLPRLISALWQRGHAVRWIHTPAELSSGDVCLLLSCSRLLSNEQLALHRHNLVVHESALPKGQGWSPMTWQIIEGVSSVPITLFEAVADLDTGPIYLQQQITLKGDELVGEWRALQGQATLDLCLTWFDSYQQLISSVQTQRGESSHYPRRRPDDSQLDPCLSIVESFNLLRVVDNQRYPAFFNWRGRRYFLHVYRDTPPTP